MRCEKLHHLQRNASRTALSIFAAVVTSVTVLTTPYIASAAPGLDSAVAVAPYLDGVFPTASPGSAEGEWVQVDYYPGLSFVEPIPVSYTHLTLPTNREV